MKPTLIVALLLLSGCTTPYKVLYMPAEQMPADCMSSQCTYVDARGTAVTFKEIKQ